jgi:hypothetical protein
MACLGPSVIVIPGAWLLYLAGPRVLSPVFVEPFKYGPKTAKYCFEDWKLIIECGQTPTEKHYENDKE